MLGSVRHLAGVSRLILVAAAVFAAVVFGGCSGGGSEKKAKVATPIDPATAGSIQVAVSYSGPPVPPKEINMQSAPQCAKTHSGPVLEETVSAKDGHLANAIVWIKSGLEKYEFVAPDKPVTLNQLGCLYEPRVAAAMVDQTIDVVNSDPEAHNVHGRPKELDSWNFMMSRKGSTRQLVFDRPEIGIPVGCDIHSWMRAYLAVLPNPYFGVTPASGELDLTNVPPGDYVIQAWHEKLGTVEQQVTLPPSGKVTVRLTYAG